MNSSSAVEGKRLVIDTCVCRSSGGTESDDGFSRECSEILYCVYKNDYYFVCTPEIQNEIMDSLSMNLFSYFVHQWFRNMITRRRVYSPSSPTINERLRMEITTIPLERKQLDAILKDVHLIEAANCTDNRIISCDRNAFDNFKLLSASYENITGVMWIDLNDPPLDVKKWLEEGASFNIRHTFASYISSN